CGVWAAQVETALLLLLHLREEALKQEILRDEALSRWLRSLLPQLTPLHELDRLSHCPIPLAIQKLLLRLFLRLAQLQQGDSQIQQQLRLPSTACLDVCLCWEAADADLSHAVAAALLAALKPAKRQQLADELREVIPSAIDHATGAISALSRRPERPLVPTRPAAEGGEGVQEAWQEAAAVALHALIDALATLRVATCCLPNAFALQLWEGFNDADGDTASTDRPGLNFMAQRLAAPKDPFSAPLRAAYAVTSQAPWYCASDSLLPLRLQQAAERVRRLACSCLVGASAAVSHNVRETLSQDSSTRQSRRSIQQAEDLLQHWGDSLLQLFEVHAQDSASVSSTAPAPSSGQAKQGDGRWALSQEDEATVQQLQEMLPSYGQGYLYLALREQKGDADEVVSLLMENMQPAALRNVPVKATLEDAAALLEAEEKGSAPPLGSTPDGADLERQILALAERAAEEALLEDSEVSGGSLYDDDADEELLLAQAAAAPFSPAETEAEESSSEEEKCKEVPAPGIPTKRLVSSALGRTPVRGGTLAARRKETNKASIGNHSRRNQRRRKIERCMGP
ncbi:uncharacterized protein LOC34617803, partial [Cyclospora cayetanensis]|uniref:Uncharacterized protein LOC34617803 n=1 Tax=Cyclospora cayetanensis TaxID=88456 RepID=A0A6P6RYP4_9EIME